MAYPRIPLDEAQDDLVAAYRCGGGNPVGVVENGVVLFFLVSTVDVVKGQVPAPGANDISAAISISEASTSSTDERGSKSKKLLEIVNLSEAAKITGKSKSTISRNIAADRLPAVRAGSAVNIKVTDLAEMFPIIKSLDGVLLKEPKE